MRTVQIADRVESEVQSTEWHLLTEPNDENFDSLIKVSEMDEAELAKAAGLLKCSPELIAELNSYLGGLRDAIHSDLADLYDKVS